MEERDTEFRDDDFWIPAQVVEQFDAPSLTQWMADILVDEEGAIEESDIGPPSYLASRYYQSFSIEGKLRFQDALLANLREVAENPDSRLLGEGGDNLLLLVNNLYHGALEPGGEEPPSDKTRENRLHAIPLLLAIFGQERFKSVFGKRHYGEKGDRSMRETLHWRAGQTLAALKYQAMPTFWAEFVREHGDDYADIAFWGMSRSHFQDAITWLAENSHRAYAVGAFLGSLPWLAEQHAPDETRAVIEKILPLLPPKDQDDLLKIRTLLKL